MKKLILILMVGSLFGDTVVYNNDILMFKRTKTLSDVSFVEVLPVDGKPNIKILISSNILGEKHTWIPCDKILELNDDNGSPIEFDCNELTTVHKYMSFNPGGLLLAIGGGLLYSTLDREAPELKGETLDAYEKWGKNMEEFIDGITTTQKIGYGCIIVGGLFLSMGPQLEDKEKTSN